MRKSILRLCALALFGVMSNMAFAGGGPVEATYYFEAITKPTGEGEGMEPGTAKLVTVFNPTQATVADIPEILDVNNLSGNILQGAVSGGKYTVTVIGKEAFASCEDQLTEVSVPNSVIEIQERAFNTAKAVTIYLGDTPNIGLKIHPYAFRNQTVTDIPEPSEGSITRTGGSSNSTVYFYAKGNVPHKKDDPLAIDDSKTIMHLENYANIQPGAFAYAKVAATVYLPNYEDNEIPANMFIGTTGLTNVVLPSDSKLQKVGKWAFAYCTDLTYLGYKTTYIDNYYFFPKTFTEVGDYSFAGCRKLSYKIVRAEDDDARISDVGDYAFYGCTAFVAGDAYYNNEEPVSAFEKHFAKFDKLTYGEGSFSNCALTGVNLNSSEQNEIPEYAFQAQKSSSLTNIILPNECISIGAGAFKSNKADKLYLPNTLKEINADAFYCALTPTAGEPNTTIYLVSGDYPYAKENKHANHLPASLKLIGNNALYGRNIGKVYTHGYIDYSGQTPEYVLPELKTHKSAKFYYSTVTVPVQVVNGEISDLKTQMSNNGWDATKLAYPTYASETVLNNGVTYKVGAQDPTTGMYAVKVAANPIGDGVDDNATVFAQFIGKADNNGYVPAFYLTGFETAGEAGHTTFDKTITFDTAVGSNETYALDPTKDATTLWCNNKLRKDYEPVTALPHRFFLSYGKLTGVVFKSGITEVGIRAFQDCKSLKSVTFGDVTSIGEYAFLRCKALEDVTVNSVELFKVGNQFNGCIALKSFTANKLKVINDNMFNTATALETVNVPAVTEIGANAFDGTALNSITTGAVTKIGASAFKGTKITEASYASVKDLGANAFEGCTGLATVSFPAVSNLGESAFSGCTALNSVTLGSATLPATVFANTGADLQVTTGAPAIGATAFTDSKLASLTANNLTEIPANAFNGLATLKTITAANVATIGANAFEGCTGLTTINAENVATIGANAFKGCTGLAAVSFPAVSSLGESAFSGCTVLNSVTLGSATLPATVFANTGTGLQVTTGATAIDAAAFTGSELATLNAGELTDIPEVAFKNLATLTTINAEKVATIGANAFEGCTGLATVSFPALKVPSVSGTTSVGAYAFDGCTGLTFVTLGNGNDLTLGSYIFKGAGSEAGFVVSTSATKLTANSFAESKVSDVLAYQAKSLDKTTFKNCDKLKFFATVALTSIPASTFASSSIEEVEISALNSIGASAFADSKLKSIKPAKVNYAGAYFTKELKSNGIGASAFAGTPLVAVNFSEATLLTTIPDNAFSNCQSLSSVELGNVATIGANAFSNCQSLSSVELGNVVTIGANAFEGDIALEEVKLPETLYTVSESAFAGTGLTEITLPVSLQHIGVNAFATESLGKVSVSYTEVPELGEDEDPFIVNEETGLYYATLVTDKRELYIGKECWKKFIAGNGIEIYVNDDRFATTDDGKYILNDDVEKINVVTGGEGDFTYVRNFKCDSWQCWYVPFDLDVKNAPEGFTFAKLWDTDLKGGATRIEFKEINEGVIKANVPYLVKPEAPCTMELPFSEIKATPSKATTIKVSNLENEYTFTGIYATKRYQARDNWYALVATDDPEYKELNGSFAKAGTKDGKDATLGAYRFFMTIAANKSNPTDYVKLVVLDDEDATGISDINAGEIADGAMFDLQGRKINAPVKGQVYIQNGVKKLAK